MRFFMPLGHDRAYSRGKIENRTNFSNQAEPKPTSDFTVAFKPCRALKLWDEKHEPWAGLSSSVISSTVFTSRNLVLPAWTWYSLLSSCMKKKKKFYHNIWSSGAKAKLSVVGSWRLAELAHTIGKLTWLAVEDEIFHIRHWRCNSFKYW